MSTDEEDTFIVGFDFVENKKIQNIRSFIIYLLTPPGGAITLIKGQRSTDSLLLQVGSSALLLSPGGDSSPLHV